MRLFLNQPNIIITDPLIDNDPTSANYKLPITTATGTVKLFDGADLVADSDVNLSHTTGGVYSATLPILSVVDKHEYNIEIILLVGAQVVWYFKGPVTAVIRRFNTGA